MVPGQKRTRGGRNDENVTYGMSLTGRDVGRRDFGRVRPASGRRVGAAAAVALRNIENHSRFRDTSNRGGSDPKNWDPGVHTLIADQVPDP